MAFQPRMMSKVTGVRPVYGSRSLTLDRMAIDYWKVDVGREASGHYVSPDPRFVVFLKGNSMSLGRVGSGAQSVCHACFVPANLPLIGAIGPPRSLEHLDIHIDAAFLRAVVGTGTPLNQPLFLPNSPDLHQIASTLAGECRETRRPAGFSEALGIAMIHEVFALASERRQAGAVPDPLARAMAHARDHLDQPLSVDALAEVAGISRATLTRMFIDHTRLTPWRWVMGERIEQARALLAEGESVGTAAHAAGFADQAHFSRCFKSATGLPPARWLRESNRSNDEPVVQDR